MIKTKPVCSQCEAEIYGRVKKSREGKSICAECAKDRVVRAQRFTILIDAPEDQRADVIKKWMDNCRKGWRLYGSAKNLVMQELFKADPRPIVIKNGFRRIDPDKSWANEVMRRCTVLLNESFPDLNGSEVNIACSSAFTAYFAKRPSGFSVREELFNPDLQRQGRMGTIPTFGHNPIPLNKRDSQIKNLRLGEDGIYRLSVVNGRVEVGKSANAWFDLKVHPGRRNRRGLHILGKIISGEFKLLTGAIEPDIIRGSGAQVARLKLVYEMPKPIVDTRREGVMFAAVTPDSLFVCRKVGGDGNEPAPLHGTPLKRVCLTHRRRVQEFSDDRKFGLRGSVAAVTERNARKFDEAKKNLIGRFVKALVERCNRAKMRTLVWDDTDRKGWPSLFPWHQIKTTMKNQCETCGLQFFGSIDDFKTAEASKKMRDQIIETFKKLREAAAVKADDGSVEVED